MNKSAHVRCALVCAILVGCVLAAVYASFPFDQSFGVTIPFYSASEMLEKVSNGSRRNETTSVTEEEPCVFPLTSNVSDLLTPLERHKGVSYAIPRLGSRRALLSERLLEDETVFNFVHINKAGGTLIKEEVFKPVSRQRKWDGVGWGSSIGWKQLLRPCPPSGVSPYSVADEALACGNEASLSPCGPVGGGSCPVRLIWGTHAMGLCQLHPNRPCVMAIILRHPIERAISQYNYVCVEGKEGRKKWADEWKQMNRCPLTLIQFLNSELTSHTFLMDHLARAADPVCGMNIALGNLLHPCMRFLMLDNLADGLGRLAKIWGPAMKPHLEKVAAKASAEKKNHSFYPPRVKSQTDDPEVQKQLRVLLGQDIEFYENAVQFYEKQWDVPLESCNDFIE